MRRERSLKHIRNGGVDFIRVNWPSLMATLHLGSVTYGVMLRMWKAGPPLFHQLPG